MSGSRVPAALAAVVLVALLAGVVLWTTPWRPLRGPVPGGRTPVDAGRDFTDEEARREEAFHGALRPPAYAGIVLGLLAAAALGLSPLGARLVQALGRPFGGGWAAQAVLGGLVVALLPRLVTLPLDARSEVVRRRYGLSTRDWGSWTADQLKAYAVSAAVLGVALLGFYAIARAAPRTWWAWAGVAGAVLTVALSFGYPLLVEPLFNRFSSLPAGELRTSLLELADRDGVPVRDVLVADASRRTTALNAYVSGLGATRRIVVYDTLLRDASPEEVRLVVAHELGHVKANDVRNGTLIGALGMLTATPLLWLLGTWTPLLRRAGVTNLADPRSAALLLFIVGALTLLTAPALTLVSRRVEARADVHSLDLTRDPATFAVSERRLGVRNLSDLDPHPLVYAMFFTHPSAPQRIATARDWARREGVAVPGDLRGVPVSEPAGSR